MRLLGWLGMSCSVVSQVSDLKREISVKYNVLSEDGVALRGLFLIDREVWLQQPRCDEHVCAVDGGMFGAVGMPFSMHLAGRWQRASLMWHTHLQGVIQHSTINNLAFGRNIEETQRVLQALKYVQVGEANCEAPGSECSPA